MDQNEKDEKRIFKVKLQIQKIPGIDKKGNPRKRSVLTLPKHLTHKNIIARITKVGRDITWEILDDNYSEKPKPTLKQLQDYFYPPEEVFTNMDKTFLTSTAKIQSKCNCVCHRDVFLHPECFPNCIICQNQNKG